MTWLSALVSSAHDAIIGISPDGTIVSWNRSAEEAFGYSADEAIGVPLSDLADPAKPGEVEYLLAQVSHGQRVERYETTRRKKDGTIIPVSVTISPIRDAAGNLIGLSEIARDISERREAEERLRLKTRELHHRTLNFVSIAEAIVRLTQAETVPEFREAIARRLNALARTHALVMNADGEKVNLLALVRAELAAFRSEKAEISIEGPSILLDAESAQSLALVFHELTTNAVKYGALAREGGRLVVATEWNSVGNRVAFRWREYCSHPIEPPTSEGFGTSVVRRAVRRQLRGRVRMDWKSDGLDCEVTIPVERIQEEQ